MISTEHENLIAITIAIENRSGKIRDRFSFFNRDHDPDQKPFRKNR
jgi:hypothetical protein